MNAPAKRQTAWEVYLGRRMIDIVYFTTDCDAEYVRSSLINHDGYDSNIAIRRVP